VYWTSINISCNRETLEICKTIIIVISNSLKWWFSVPGRFPFNPYFYFFSFMSVLIDSLILKTLNSVLDIELTYRITKNLFKLVKQFISSFQIHWSCVFTSWKIFFKLLFLFLFLHECLNRFIDFKDFK
jgi:hypothetical protein